VGTVWSAGKWIRSDAGVHIRRSTQALLCLAGVLCAQTPSRPRAALGSPDLPVWDPGGQNNQASVPTERRVESLYSAKDVRVRRFGGEGTGAQSFFTYGWKIGQTYKFMVQATV